MKLFALCALGVPTLLGAPALLSSPSPAPQPAAIPQPVLAPVAAPAPHCQVPCGVYGDAMRIDMLMEDAATIEKGMNLLNATGDQALVMNQAIRWTMTKEQHAQNIQDQIAAYWLTQRIKPLAADADEAAKTKHKNQLQLLHGMLVAAMKCKQTTDVAHVAALRDHARRFSGTYFSADGLKQIRSFHDDKR